MPLHLLKETVSYRVLAAVALGAAAVPAFATDSFAQDGPRELPAVSVEGAAPTGPAEGSYQVEGVASPKYTEPLRDTPQTINVVPSTVIEERAATSLRDVLRNVPGISLVAGEGGGPQGDSLRIRGFAANTDLFVDQMRDPAQYNRDPFFVEQVEVVKGPSSTYVGRGSTGGSVNLVTKTPRLGAFVDGIATLGTDETMRGTIDVNQPLAPLGFTALGGAAFRLAAMAHDSETAGRDVVEDTRYGFAPSLVFGLGRPTRVTLSGLYFEEHNIPDYGLPLVGGQPVADLDRSNFYGFRNLNTEDVTVEMTTLEIEHDLNESVTLRNQLRREYATRFSIVSPPRNPNVAAGTVTRNPTGRDGDTEFWINQTDATLRFATGPLGHTVVTGIELADEHAENQRITFAGAPLDNLFNPNPDAAFTGTRTPQAKTDVEADTFAYYLFDTIKIGENWQVLGGARWDRFAADFKQDDIELSRVDRFWSTRGAVVYKPAPNGSIYAGYGTSFNPSAEALSLSADVSSNAFVGLDPEENESYELGTKWDLLDESLSVNFAVFRTEKTNARTEDPDVDVVVLQGTQRVEGFEIGLAGNVTDTIQVIGGYAYMRSEILSSVNAAEVGNPVGNTPKHTFTLWATWETPWNLQLGAGGQFVGRRTVSNSNPNRVPAYAVFDAMAAYHLTESIDIRLNVLNITDKFYFERLHGGGSHGVPGAGRTALVSFAFRL